MRGLVAAAIIAAGLSFAAIPSASAAPAIGAAALGYLLEHTSDLEAIAQGCGRGWHRNRFGRCVPNRRGRRCRWVCRW